MSNSLIIIVIFASIIAGILLHLITNSGILSKLTTSTKDIVESKIDPELDNIISSEIPQSLINKVKV